MNILLNYHNEHCIGTQYCQYLEQSSIKVRLLFSFTQTISLSRYFNKHLFCAKELFVKLFLYIEQHRVTENRKGKNNALKTKTFKPEWKVYYLIGSVFVGCRLRMIQVFSIISYHFTFLHCTLPTSSKYLLSQAEIFLST